MAISLINLRNYYIYTFELVDKYYNVSFEINSCFPVFIVLHKTSGWGGGGAELKRGEGAR